jgi:GT2 family glycosyltransferase
MHKKKLYLELGGFDTSLRRWVDWDLILRYTSKYPPSVVPVALCNYNDRRNISRISSQEPSAYEMVVRNKHLIDWQRLENNIAKRIKDHVTIVIPVFNQALLTENCIHSIFKVTKGIDFDVLIVDNRSNFMTKAVIWNLERTFERLSHVENSSNYFFALGCNMGVAASVGEFVVLLNNDTVVTGGWLNHLIEPLKADPSVGIAGPRLLYPDKTLQAGGMAFSDLSKIPYHIYVGLSADDPAINKQRYFQALTGACFAIRAEDYIKLRGLDPIFQNGCEDIDLCFRLRNHLGKKVIYNPVSVIIHYEGKTKGRGDAIKYNRKTFVSRWGHTIIPDDMQYYKQDGYVVKGYIKKDNFNPQESIFKPVLERESI